MKTLKTIYQSLNARLKHPALREKKSTSLDGSINPSAGPEKTTSGETDGNSWTVCGSIDDLILLPFIKLQCYDDIGQLIVSGSPPKEALEKARIEIISQFNEVCPNPVSAQHLRIGKTIHYHAKKIERVTDLVEACRASYSPRLIQLLKDDGYKGEFSFETIDADLNRIEDSLRGDLHKLRKAEAEYKSLESKSEKKKPSKQQYIRTMEQYNAVFNTNKSIFQPIRVIEYATMVNTLNDHYKSLSSKEK